MDGELEMRAGERTIQAKAGTTIFAPREIPHGFQVGPNLTRALPDPVHARESPRRTVFSAKNARIGTFLCFSLRLGCRVDRPNNGAPRSNARDHHDRPT